MEFVKIEESQLKQLEREKKIAEVVKNNLKHLSQKDLQQNIHSLSLIRHVCELVENKVRHQNVASLRADKKKIAISILQDINGQPFNEENRLKIEQMIDYLHSHGLIKKIPLYQKLLSFFLDILKKILVG